jgi:hypothetical protein
MEVLVEGQQINHALYGFGTVTESDEDRTTVEFRGHGVKKFVTNLMQAELLGVAPSRPRKSRRRKPAAGASAPSAATTTATEEAEKKLRRR